MTGTSTTLGPTTTMVAPLVTTTQKPQATKTTRAPRPTSTTTGVPTTVATTTSTTTTTVTPVATAPALVPQLLDARQGFGTPCEPTSTRNPAGCFFFVYATTTTRGSFHRLYSDAGFSTEPLGTSCGTQSVHHWGEDTCAWYLGPVYGRTAGQQECFWATTVSGGRESEPSNRVCLTWSNQAA